ncbi:MAG: nucleotide exchange factor GrpE [Phyllobacteriaceae bacterium]|nr:nucleotide exchange factor GrpE [Phyllobacteriaceae bacterium]
MTAEPNDVENTDNPEIPAEAAPVDPAEALAAENAELKDRLLRLAAEMENLRRRTSRDVHDARSYAIANFARDMLTVADNLKRALDAVPSEAAAADPAVAALSEGVDLTQRSLVATLERHGVKKLTPLGERFDPNYHQAMFEAPDESRPANTVIHVAQDGYVIGERMLRPAMVGVSKGGPKAAAEPGPVDGEAAADA